MTGYILSIMGVVIAGVFIDIILPTGTINKYIKSLYGIFVLAVILSPIIKFMDNHHNISVDYIDYEINQTLLGYIHQQRVAEIEKKIVNSIEKEGYTKIGIKLNYSTKDNNITINSCEVNLSELSITSDNQHINKYEFITEIVHKYTDLSEEVIIFYE